MLEKIRKKFDEKFEAIEARERNRLWKEFMAALKSSTEKPTLILVDSVAIMDFIRQLRTEVFKAVPAPYCMGITPIELAMHGLEQSLVCHAPGDSSDYHPQSVFSLLIKPSAYQQQVVLGVAQKCLEPRAEEMVRNSELRGL